MNPDDTLRDAPAFIEPPDGFGLHGYPVHAASTIPCPPPSMPGWDGFSSADLDE